jgi:hypothetical protein
MNYEKTEEWRVLRCLPCAFRHGKASLCRPFSDGCTSNINTWFLVFGRAFPVRRTTNTNLCRAFS